MGLICMPLNKIYLIPILYYVMFGIGGFLTFPVMDKIGRRKTCMIFGAGIMAAYTMTMYATSYTSRMIGFSLMGFMMA